MILGTILNYKLRGEREKEREILRVVLDVYEYSHGLYSGVPIVRIKS